MSKYRVRFYTGDYSERQAAANRDGAVFYCEGHANASTNQAADYAMCVVATNASARSIFIAKVLARRWGELLDVGGDRDTDFGYGNGVRIGGAGDGNLSHTAMPAVLCEPGFASNPDQAVLMESTRGLDLIAEPLADVIRETFPEGGLVAFSIGHVGKKSSPADRGAAWTGIRFASEAEFAAAYLHRAAALLEDDQLTAAHVSGLGSGDDGALPHCPAWEDVRTFDGRPWGGRVDVVSGGIAPADDEPIGPAVLILTHAGVEVGRVLIPAGVDAHIEPLPETAA